MNQLGILGHLVKSRRRVFHQNFWRIEFFHHTVLQNHYSKFNTYIGDAVGCL